MLQYSCLLILSVILFLHVFFPTSNSNIGPLSDPPVFIGNIPANTEFTYRPHFQKTILIVIDALRWDFASPQLMPLTMGLISQKGCLSKVSVESPTVTMPRIKALTTGSIPQYIDVVMNLASSEVLGDSWLHSAKNKGLKTVFYGDNTWERLFPDFFDRSEGTTSFFVWDFTEVDDNVTRNVDLELQRSDWDIMILHYLGLDHIGHVLGPFSSKMPTKLAEMDRIIHKIYKNTNNTETLMLITGDHGMRDAGGHGGTSQAEITVPLVTIGHNCKISSFKQTDIPANLAVLLGLRIPSSSTGNIRKDFLLNLDESQYLFALRYNTEVLLKKNDMCQHIFNQATDYHENYLQTNSSVYGQMAQKLYQNCSETITERLYEASIKQDVKSLVLVLLVLLNVLILLVLGLMNVPKCNDYHWEMMFCCCVIVITFFFKFANVFGIVFAFLITLKVKNLIPFTRIMKNLSGTHIFLVTTCILHPLTFVSTSFIEEEHYFWIFSTITLMVIQILIRQDLKLGLAVLCLRCSMDLNSTKENSVQNENNWANILMAEGNQGYHQAFFTFSLILVFLTLYEEQKTSKQREFLHVLSFITLTCIFLLKLSSYHNTFLGKLIWGLILSQKVFRDFSYKQLWILSSTLLIKPHNVTLIPLAAFIGHQIGYIKEFKSPMVLAVVSYMLSNCFYFLQGHRNSLATVDVSIGYTGLNDYIPIFVGKQILMHTYIFPVLFHLIAFEHICNATPFWNTLLALRTSVFLFTGIITIAFRHHLFVWSVFAPKLFIESVHAAFLFLEMCLWYLHHFFKKTLIFLKIMDM